MRYGFVKIHTKQIVMITLSHQPNGTRILNQAFPALQTPATATLKNQDILKWRWWNSNDVEYPKKQLPQSNAPCTMQYAKPEMVQKSYDLIIIIIIIIIITITPHSCVRRIYVTKINAAPMLKRPQDSEPAPNRRSSLYKPPDLDLPETNVLRQVHSAQHPTQSVKALL